MPSGGRHQSSPSSGIVSQRPERQIEHERPQGEQLASQQQSSEGKSHAAPKPSPWWGRSTDHAQGITRTSELGFRTTRRSANQTEPNPLTFKGPVRRYDLPGVICFVPLNEGGGGQESVVRYESDAMSRPATEPGTTVLHGMDGADTRFVPGHYCRNLVETYLSDTGGYGWEPVTVIRTETERNKITAAAMKGLKITD